MAAPSLSLLTPEEYFAAEEKAETRHEYYRGVMMAMAGGTSNHNLIAISLCSALVVALRGRNCRVYGMDMRLSAAEDASHYTYPDVMAVCGELQFVNKSRTTLTKPVLIVEVLSPSTELADRGRKAIDYRKLESLREYMLVSQSEPRVELYRRMPSGGWEIHDFTGLDTVLPLLSVDCSLALADVYDKVTFEPEPEPEAA